MGRKAFSGIMVLIILLISTLTLAFNIQTVKSTWTGTVYIRADGSIDPPDAPIITYDNVTYTLTDNITSTADGIVVERNNIIIDGAGYTLQGSGAHLSKGVDLSGRTNVTVRDTQIKNFDYGVKLFYSSNNTVIGNNVTNNLSGVDLVYSSNNTVIGNNVTNNGLGVYLYYSSNNIISGNTFIGDGFYVLNSYHNVVVDNIVNGKPLVYLEGVVDYSVGDAGQVILVNCAGIRVENLNLSHTTVGVELWQTNNSVINGNNITANYDFGVELFYSSNNIISGNNITNNWCGVHLYYSSNNTVSGNNIVNNDYGVDLWGSSNNSISENNITNNQRGATPRYSSNNWFYHNNFIDNAEQVVSIWSVNVWDDGYPSGGNYWSDYEGIDYYSGPYQNETGSDGIGDTPYVIDENNIDHYPLMNPYTLPKPPIVNATVDVNPKTLNLRSGGRWITAYIELPEGYNVQDINVSTIMLNETIPIEPKPIAIGDYDNDSIPDLMVKFDRAKVIGYILNNVDLEQLFEERFMAITLTITGYLNDGTPFQGTDTIKIFYFIPRIWRFIQFL